MTFERGMCACHGDDFGFLHEKILGAIQSAPQQLKGPELLPWEERESVKVRSQSLHAVIS